MSGIVERALIDREFDTEKNQRLLAVYIQPSKPFLAQSSAKRETRVQLASRFPLMPHSSCLCLAFCACVWRFRLVSRVSRLRLALPPCVSRLCFVLVSCVSRFALAISRFPLCLAFRACLTLRACFSLFTLVSRVSPLCLAFRPCVSRLTIAFLALLTKLLLCRLESRHVTSILHA